MLNECAVLEALPQAASEADKRVRDRGATEKAILRAAKALLSEEGFQNFGINAVARRAGCDKQLIYRYYGGLDGLVEAIGSDLGTWVRDRIPEDTGGMFLLTYGDLMERLALLFLQALRDDPLMRRIVAWEVSENTEQVRRLAESRSKALSQWLERMKGSLAPPKGVDAAAVNAILIAAIQHLVLSASAGGQCVGLALKTPKDWEKAATALKRIVRGVYG
ncbi:TetR/AcrR family transcriptional regulator [Rhizobium sp. SEMIA 4085]|uniref:TetR family transcriptional regulator protein n=1 Tax=Rhizobium gallicum bv. gallicum R602sp TaxID=1041138 RepID=A0A0B4WYV7_9HYPH|nr:MULTISPECIES: TetR/AcrR family transcriptional regulator [Rhizobium]AJD40864.1 TetR family transcriptional regulator protein [Rhizobium gallicum bv. gallicum R602sp]NNH28939.1 TetR/AcrR family transcriptional regulator [Rhizobium sp. SEMIA 4085]